MLQPLQLEEVKGRYANEIAELQDFLQKAGCTLGAPESLHAIVNRLQRDRSFHRDVTSYIWVAIHSGNRNISYADLLGVLAIAAAGGRYAAEAEGDDAHALLRFVIEARESLDGRSRRKNQPANSPAPPVAPPQPAHAQPGELEPAKQQPGESQPANVRLVQQRTNQQRTNPQRTNQERTNQERSNQQQPVQSQPRPARSRPVRSQQVEPQPVQSQPAESQQAESAPVDPQPVKERPLYEDDGPLYPHARPFPEFSALKDEEEEGSGTRKRLIWLTVFFLAAALVARIAFHNLNFKALNDTASPEPAVTAPAESSAPVTNHEGTAAQPAPHTEATPEPEVATPAPAAPEERADPTPHAGSRTRSTRRTPPVNPPASDYPSASPQPRVTTPAGPAPKIPPPPESRSTPTPAPATTTPAARPASSSGPDLTNTDRGRPVPHLLRRTPEDQTELADASPPANIPSPTNASTNTSTMAASRPAPAATPQAPRGSVRAISLGVNASNVLYSPTPAYPQAASDAHVQGDVKVETNVDRNGNVASVRVVSGPPLLRDAALDAAQRWRYRPHFIGGEQAAMSAITVFEFHLP